MTSQLKIDSNKRNATRSTGPRTKTGKTKASRNAFCHGLAAKFGTAEVDAGNVAVLASALAGEAPSSISEARAAAESELELIHIRKVRARFWGVFQEAVGSGNRHASLLELLTEAESLDRYERRAISRKRTAFRDLLG